MGDETALDDGEVEFGEDGFLGLVEVEGGKVGVDGGLDGDEELFGEDEGDLAGGGGLDPEGDAGRGADGLDDGGGPCAFS